MIKMAPSKVIKLGQEFRVKLAQEAVEPKTDYNQNEYLKISSELNNVIEGFLKRNPLPLSSTKKPSIQQKTEGQEGRVAIGVIITQQDLDNYINKLNNEIYKLDQKYDGLRIYSFYDTNDPRKAKI